eukprot:2104104-Pyramimonas_sp.AAC.1
MEQRMKDRPGVWGCLAKPAAQPVDGRQNMRTETWKCAGCLAQPMARRMEGRQGGGIVIW